MTSHNSDRDSGHSPLSRRVVNAFLGAGCLVSISGFLGAALAFLWPAHTSFWFAWVTFWENTRVWQR